MYCIIYMYHESKHYKYKHFDATYSNYEYPFIVKLKQSNTNDNNYIVTQLQRY